MAGLFAGPQRLGYVQRKRAEAKGFRHSDTLPNEDDMQFTLALEEGLKAAAAKQVALVQRWYNAEMALGEPQMVSSARGEGLDVLAAAADSAVAMWLRAVPQGKGLLVLQDGLDYMTRDGPRRLLARLLCRHKGLHLLVTLSRKGSQAQGLDEKPLSPHVTELGRVVPLPSLSHHEAAQVFVSLLYRRGQDRLLNGLTRDKAVELLQDEKLLRNCKGQLGEVLSAVDEAISAQTLLFDRTPNGS